ncbi:MAG: adenylosuccinate lyase [Bdellovibrio sp.]|nr:adenylosuccinate lyase [Bdellovibrio sp.]
MIARYTQEEMANIWSDQNRYLLWLRVEEAVCEELLKHKLISQKEWKILHNKFQKLISKGGVSPDKVNFCEKITRHDVIAFTTVLAKELGPLSRYVHFGLTSSDVVDTALALQIKQSGDILLKDIDRLLRVLKQNALKYKSLPTIGRSHGIFAEPMAFGLKFLGWYAEWKRNKTRLSNALNEICFGKLSGAVGVNSHFSPAEEKRILKRLDLQRETVSTQVVPRDRHAEILSTLGILGSSLERMAVELRHLQRSEVGEVLEGFESGQKGSSAMPHKRNPISAENLTGCARVLRAYAQTGLENMALWHERDISHSSVERIVFPDSFILLDYALCRMTRMLDSLVVCKDRVLKNLETAGPLVFSGHYLLRLVQMGVNREDGYRWIQKCALESLDQKKDFFDLMKNHPEIKKYFKTDEFKKENLMSYQLRNVSKIYYEVFRNK